MPPTTPSFSFVALVLVLLLAALSVATPAGGARPCKPSRGEARVQGFSLADEGRALRSRHLLQGEGEQVALSQPGSDSEPLEPQSDQDGPQQQNNEPSLEPPSGQDEEPVASSSLGPDSEQTSEPLAQTPGQDGPQQQNNEPPLASPPDQEGPQQQNNPSSLSGMAPNIVDSVNSDSEGGDLAQPPEDTRTPQVLVLEQPLPPPEDTQTQEVLVLEQPLPPPEDTQTQEVLVLEQPLPPPEDTRTQEVLVLEQPLPPPEDTQVLVLEQPLQPPEDVPATAGLVDQSPPADEPLTPSACGFTEGPCGPDPCDLSCLFNPDGDQDDETGEDDDEARDPEDLVLDELLANPPGAAPETTAPLFEVAETLQVVQIPSPVTTAGQNAPPPEASDAGPEDLQLSDPFILTTVQQAFDSEPTSLVVAPPAASAQSVPAPATAPQATLETNPVLAPATAPQVPQNSEVILIATPSIGEEEASVIFLTPIGAADDDDDDDTSPESLPENGAFFADAPPALSATQQVQALPVAETTESRVSATSVDTGGGAGGQVNVFTIGDASESQQVSAFRLVAVGDTSAGDDNGGADGSQGESGFRSAPDNVLLIYDLEGVYSNFTNGVSSITGEPICTSDCASPCAAVPGAATFGISDTTCASCFAGEDTLWACDPLSILGQVGFCVCPPQEEDPFAEEDPIELIRDG